MGVRQGVGGAPGSQPKAARDYSSGVFVKLEVASQQPVKLPKIRYVKKCFFVVARSGMREPTAEDAAEETNLQYVLVRGRYSSKRASIQQYG